MPSCRRRNFPKRFDGFDKSDDEGDGTEVDSLPSTSKVNPGAGLGAPKIMANSLATDGEFWGLGVICWA